MKLPPWLQAAGPCLLGLLWLAGCDQSSSTPQESSNVLAISWQPAFCETASRKPECRDISREDPAAGQFSLHGLWPQPGTNVYCGVEKAVIETDKSGRWRDLPIDRLPQPLWDRLRIAMPGTRSALHRHEWIKHGTCMPGATAQTYFATSIALLEAVNASAVGKLFAANIGRELRVSDIRAAFDAGFGPGAGKRVRMACERDGSRQIIREVTIGLVGKIGERPDIRSLMAAAGETDSGCPAGIVDPVGNQ
ncbi:MAG: ribonuclease [Rhizobiaceae bacterium]